VFLLVPADPVSPRQRAVKRLCVSSLLIKLMHVEQLNCYVYWSRCFLFENVFAGFAVYR